MDCTITSTRRGHVSRRRGLALVEVLVAAGIAGLIFTAVAVLMFYSARSFAALTNYVDLDSSSLHALDRMSSEIRQVDRLISYTPTRLEFRGTDPETGDPYTLVYQYDRAGRTLNRMFNDESSVLLKECLHLKFSIFQRNPVGGSYDQYPVSEAGRPELCKMVQLDWLCSRKIFDDTANTESMRSAKFVIRKQGA